MVKLFQCINSQFSYILSQNSKPFYILVPKLSSAKNSMFLFLNHIFHSNQCSLTCYTCSAFLVTWLFWCLLSHAFPGHQYLVFCLDHYLVWLATKWGDKHITLNSWDPWHLRVGLGIKYNWPNVNTLWNSLPAIFTVTNWESVNSNYWPWMLHSLFSTLMLVHPLPKNTLLA